MRRPHPDDPDEPDLYETKVIARRPLPYDPGRPDLHAIQDEFNDPATVALFRAGLLPGQIAAEKRLAKQTPTPADDEPDG